MEVDRFQQTTMASRMTLSVMISYLQDQTAWFLRRSRKAEVCCDRGNANMYAAKAAMCATVCEFMQTSCRWTPMTDDAEFVDGEVYLLRVKTHYTTKAAYVSGMYNRNHRRFEFLAELQLDCVAFGYRDEFTHFRSIGEPE